MDAQQVARLAGFIARLDPEIPYVLMGFAPAAEMKDLPLTTMREAAECLPAAKAAGLKRVKIGNEALLA